MMSVTLALSFKNVDFTMLLRNIMLGISLMFSSTSSSLLDVGQNLVLDAKDLLTKKARLLIAKNING
jgi:hypothetical protein